MKKHTFPGVKKLDRQVVFEFFVPGDPKSKARARAGLSKGGKVFMRDDPRNGPRESYIRECCAAALEVSSVKDYFPISASGGYITSEVYALFNPPNHWFPGLPMTRKPDFDNLGKLVWDALSGRHTGRPPMVAQDDQIISDCRVQKMYWDPRPDLHPNYPKEPGTLVVVRAFPIPRHPSLAPPGVLVCPTCGNDEFKTPSGLTAHTRRCAPVDPM